MKYFCFIIVLFLLSFTHSLPHWQNNFDEAQKTATAEHKFILLNFSGSDWCGPCIRMHREIFNSDIFSAYADEKLVLVNADFPRLKKNQLPVAQQQENDKLADKYNSKGVFPFTILLSPDGRLIKQWDGFPKGDATSFTNEIKMAVNAVN